MKLAVPGKILIQRSDRSKRPHTIGARSVRRVGKFVWACPSGIVALEMDLLVDDDGAAAEMFGGATIGYK